MLLPQIVYVCYVFAGIKNNTTHYHSSIQSLWNYFRITVEIGVLANRSHFQI